MFDPAAITAASNFQFQTANRRFKSESGSYHTLGSQGLPILRATLTWDLDSDVEFDGWFNPETIWLLPQFLGMLWEFDVQAAGLPKKTFTHTGVSISLDVAMFPMGPHPAISNTGSVPAFIMFAGVESGYANIVEQNVVKTGGRVSLRTPTGPRGETFDISWVTGLTGVFDFFHWYSEFGRKQFLASFCGKVGWLWKIVAEPSFSILQGNSVRISMSVCGRDVRRGLSNVTISKGW